MSGRTPFAVLRKLCVGCVIAALFFAACSPAKAQQTRASEAEVKAAFVFSFAKFVDWPAEALGPAQRFVICIAGDRQLAVALSLIVEDRKLNGHELLIRQRTPGAVDFNGCHIVFVADRQQWRRVINDLRAAAVLTIGDGEEFARKGGMIAFVLENERVRFVMNPAAAERARLKISSRLLALARIVEEEKGL